MGARASQGGQHETTNLRKVVSCALADGTCDGLHNSRFKQSCSFFLTEPWFEKEAEEARNKALDAKKAKAKVDVEGAKKKAQSEQAKADKEKGDKEAAELKTKEIPNE